MANHYLKSDGQNCFRSLASHGHNEFISSHNVFQRQGCIHIVTVYMIHREPVTSVGELVYFQLTYNYFQGLFSLILIDFSHIMDK